MARSLKDLSKSMRERAKGLEEIGSQLSIDGTTAMLKEMVEVSPVDTSIALSNWQVSLNNPVANEISAHYVGRHGSSRAASSNEAIAEGVGELQYKKPGQPVFLSNIVNYISDLDDGSSTQFPGGFIPRALIVFRLAVRESAKRLLK